MSSGVIEFLHRWQWLVAAFVAGAPTVYYGPKKVLETWDWYVHRFRDEPILRVMRDCKLVPHPLTIPSARSGELSPTTVSILKERSYSVGDLARILKRSYPSIGKSVRRLRARGEIELHRGGFRLKQ